MCRLMRRSMRQSSAVSSGCDEEAFAIHHVFAGALWLIGGRVTPLQGRTKRDVNSVENIAGDAGDRSGAAEDAGAAH
jgi:hypothetical protein